MKFILKCCGKINPIGIDKEHLRLDFETEGNIEILSYEIRIASSEEKIKKEKFDIGVFQSKNTDTYMLQPEQALFKERTKYYWQVSVTTNEGRYASHISYFETGIGNWSAQWISGHTESGKILQFYELVFTGGKNTDEYHALFEKIHAKKTVNTSRAGYVWLPLRFEEPNDVHPNGMVYIDWKDEWRIEDYEEADE